VSADDLLAEARAVASRPDRRLGTTRYVAAALLGRQALEEALEQFWQRTVPGVAGCSGRAQLITLQFFAEPELAGAVAYAWNRLSLACHHDAYELPPTHAELTSLLDIVDRFAAEASPAPAVPPPPE
jgi:hypothetical protein